MWVQWALPFGVAAAVVVALILFVHHQTVDVPQIANVSSPKAIAEQNREDTIIVRQQQAPHVVRIAAGQSGAAALRAGVAAYIRGQISHGVMDGPVKSASCHAAVGGTTSRQLFRCDVIAADFTYPFDAVVQPAAGVATYCQRVAPPIPSMNVPVNKRCT